MQELERRKVARTVHPVHRPVSVHIELILLSCMSSQVKPSQLSIKSNLIVDVVCVLVSTSLVREYVYFVKMMN